MLAVQPQQFEQPRQEISMDTVPEMTSEISEVEAMSPKQEIKQRCLTIPKVIFILAFASVLLIGVFLLFNFNETNELKSQMLQAHDKIIQVADSSKKEGSNTGSTGSSKSSKTNDKPNSQSKPASKNVITSNSQLGGSGSGGKDNEDDEEEGDKRKKKLSDKSLTNDASTDEDDSQEEEEDEAVNDVQWIDNQPITTGTTPLIGNARKP